MLSPRRARARAHSPQALNLAYFDSLLSSSPLTPSLPLRLRLPLRLSSSLSLPPSTSDPFPPSRSLPLYSRPPPPRPPLSFSILLCPIPPPPPFLSVSPHTSPSLPLSFHSFLPPSSRTPSLPPSLRVPPSHPSLSSPSSIASSPRRLLPASAYCRAHDKQAPVCQWSKKVCVAGKPLELIQ